MTVLYVDGLRERVRRERETVTLDPGSDVAAARAAIARLHPTLEPLLPMVQTAVNRVIVTAAHTLGEGDELALIPPVAGGSGGVAKIALGPQQISVDDVVAAAAGGSGEHGGVAT